MSKNQALHKFKMSLTKGTIYIDEPIDLSNINNVNKLNSLKEKGVIVVNGLDELKGVIQ